MKGFSSKPPRWRRKFEVGLQSTAEGVTALYSLARLTLVPAQSTMGTSTSPGRRRSPAFALLCSLVVALVGVMSSLPAVNAASMLAIDYGTDSFKASLVKPGVPFDVLLTKEGKRKAPAQVAYRGQDRFVGSDAQTLVSDSLRYLRCR